MKHIDARQIGEHLRPFLEALKTVASLARAARDPETTALDIAIVNLDSAIEILTE